MARRGNWVMGPLSCILGWEMRRKNDDWATWKEATTTIPEL